MGRRALLSLLVIVGAAACGTREAHVSGPTHAASAPPSAPETPPPDASAPEIPRPPLLRLQDVAMTTDEVGWAAAVAPPDEETDAPYRVYRTTDGGRTWRNVAPSDPLLLVNGTVARAASVHAIDAMRAIIVALRADQRRIILFRTSDGGATWRTTQVDKRGHGIATLGAALDFRDSSHGTMTVEYEHGMNSSDSELYVTGDGGATWKRTTHIPLDGVVRMDTASHGWLLGRGGSTWPRQLLATDDGGRTWRELVVSADGTAKFARFAQDAEALGSSVHADALRPRSVPVFTAAGRGVLVATENEAGPGWIVTSADRGAHWSPARHIASGTPEAAEVSARGVTVLVLDDERARFLVSSDLTQWSEVALPKIPLDVSSVHFTSARGGFLAAEDEKGTSLARTDDGGATWSWIEGTTQP